MKKYIKRIIKKLIEILPLNIIEIMLPIMEQIVDQQYIQAQIYYRFTKKLKYNFDEYIKKIIKNKTFMEIREGLWGCTYFNVACLNNILALMIYALYKGCIPIIKINEKSEDNFKWEWYFQQPFQDILNTSLNENWTVVDCEKKNIPFRPGWNAAVDVKSEEYEIWNFLYKKFVKLNAQTKQYVSEEIKNIGQPHKMIGILLRGTDYVTTKPSGHPIQPEPMEIFEKAHELILKKHYEKVYVATDEKKLFLQSIDYFGSNMVRSNKRTYYDEEYYSNDQINLIGQVHFHREHDNYLKGVEYLSSLMILSKCDAIVAGNCGGTLFAVLNSETTKNRYIFDRGYYQ